MKTPPFAYYLLYFCIIFMAMSGVIFAFGKWYNNEQSKAIYPANPTGITMHFEKITITNIHAPLVIEMALLQKQKNSTITEAKLEPRIAIQKKGRKTKKKIPILYDTILPVMEHIDTPKKYIPHITIKKRGS